MDCKYTIESLKREQGSLIDRKRQIEQTYCLGQIAKEDYDIRKTYEEIRKAYEDRYKELEAVINRLEAEPKINLHSDPSLINSISFMGKQVSFKFGELEEFLKLKYIDEIPTAQLRVKMAFEHMLKAYEEYGIDAFKETIPHCTYDERFGYIIKLDKVTSEE